MKSGILGLMAVIANSPFADLIRNAIEAKEEWEKRQQALDYKLKIQSYSIPTIDHSTLWIAENKQMEAYQRTMDKVNRKLGLKR